MDLSKVIKGISKGENTLLVPHIDRYIESGKFESWNIKVETRKVDDGLYHPSSHVFMTDRALWFDRWLARYQGELPDEIAEPTQGLRKPHTASLKKTFAVGHMWHCYLQTLLIQMEFVSRENVEYHQHYKITTKDGTAIGSGTIDCREVYIPGHGSDWIVDFKTMNKQEFDNGPSEFNLMKWRAQVSCYGDWEHCDNLLIIGIEKDSPHRMREFPMRRSEQVLESIYTKWTRVETMLQEGHPPECTHGLEEKCSLPRDLCSWYSGELWFES